jgi:transposase
MELFAHVLPPASLLDLETWHLDTTTAQVTLQVQSMQTLVPCPVCRFPTRRIHRRDGRPVADLPWAPWRVVLHLQVRWFCCAKGRCSRRIFTEP